MAKESSYNKSGPQLNSLLSIWYGLLVGALNVYLIVNSVKRFVWLAELSWPYQKTPFFELNAYIGLTGVGVILLPFFLAASFLKIGNSSNDNQSLGHDPNNEHESDPYTGIGEDHSRGFFHTVWKHSGPTASFLHLVSSFSLLLPQTIIEAVLSKYGHLPQDTIWRTDLDFMMSQRDRNVVLNIISTADLKNERLESNSGSLMMDHIPEVISMEYLNYALALTVFSIRYSSVFWRSNKAFAFVFSCQLIVNSFHSLLSYSCFAVLYKLHVVGPSEVLHKTPRFLLNSHVTLLLYIISAITLFLSSSVFYHYGYLRIASHERNMTRTHHVTDSSQNSRYGPGWVYFPHCSALAVVLSLVATQTPEIYDATLLYKISLDSCLLTYVTSSAIHMLFWIILWLWLTAKTKWNFQATVTPECTDGKLKNVEYNKSIVRTGSSRSKRVAFFTDGSCNDQKYSTVLKPYASDVFTNQPEGNQFKENWPGPCQDVEKQHFLAPEEQNWTNCSGFNLEYTPARNKVTFQDRNPSPRYECTPGSRHSGLKRTTPGDNLNPLFQQDIGDYALLRNGPSLSRASSIQNKQEAVQFQRVPASVSTTDSGYSGGCDNTSRSDSSTTGSRSPPIRQISSDVPNIPSASNVGNPFFDIPGEDQHSSEYSNYGKLGLVRRESIRSTIHPIYEGTAQDKVRNPIYESRKIQKILPLTEIPYEAHHLTNNLLIPNENNYSVQVNDLMNPIYGYSKQSVELSSVNNTSNPDYYKKFQDMEKTLLKTSDLNLQQDVDNIPKRNSSFRQVRICETPSEIRPQSSTSYNNNIQFDSFTEQRSPPIPPSLPTLSFLGCQRNGNLPPFSRPMSSDFGNNGCCSPLS